MIIEVLSVVLFRVLVCLSSVPAGVPVSQSLPAESLPADPEWSKDTNTAHEQLLNEAKQIVKDKAQVEPGPKVSVKSGKQSKRVKKKKDGEAIKKPKPTGVEFDVWIDVGAITEPPEGDPPPDDKTKKYLVAAVLYHELLHANEDKGIDETEPPLTGDEKKKKICEHIQIKRKHMAFLCNLIDLVQGEFGPTDPTVRELCQKHRGLVDKFNEDGGDGSYETKNCGPYQTPPNAPITPVTPCPHCPTGF